LDIGNIYLWVGFNAFVLLMLAIDLGVFNRKAHVVEVKEALIWSAVWICLALTFNLGLFYFEGKEAAFEFLAGYLIEKSLSVDNIFVFLVIFSYFKVNPKHQHKVLYWGILGALVLRATLITVGATLLDNFHWVIYVFGAFLIFTGMKMAFQKDIDIHPEENIVLRGFKKIMPVWPKFEGGKFFIVEKGKRYATPLLVVLLIVETTDLVFALDSIPAIFAVSTDPFIVYTSNVFAILGLRSLYFALSGIMGMFHYLKIGLSLILVFVGVKMVIVDLFKIPIGVALIVIAVILIASVGASMIWPKPPEVVEDAKSDPAPYKPDDNHH
jgi:tellurite resistance protein TerC